MKKLFCMVGCLGALMAVSSAETVAAQTTYDGVSSTPKGTIGLGLVGAELGLIVPSLAGLDKPWALSVFPVVGAAGGALAGYFAVDKPGHEKIAVASLIVGMAGVVPAVLLTVKAVRYDPDDDEEIPNAPLQPVLSKKDERMRDLARAGDGFVRRSASGVHVALPGVHVGTTYSAVDQVRFQSAASTQVEFSLLTGVF